MMRLLPSRAPKQFGATKKRQNVEILIWDKPVKATFIGWGQFSNVFRGKGNDVFIYTHYGDNSKEIISMCNDNPHIPPMEKIEVIDGPAQEDWDVHVFKSKYFEPFVQARSAKAWAHHKELRRVRDNCNQLQPDTRMIDSGKCQAINYCVADTARVPAPVKEALNILAETSLNFGQNFLFDDFRPRNLGLDKQGRIVFIDPLFDAELIHNDIKLRRIRGGYD